MSSFLIGYALSPQKERSFILPSLIDYAKHHGIDFIRIDPLIPLAKQSPFHCIIHNLHDPSWVRQLRHFTSRFPDAAVVDPPELISPLLNRISMLRFVDNLKIPNGVERIESPKQAAVYDLNALIQNGLDSVSDLGLNYPVIVKPLESNGSDVSRQLWLVANGNGFEGLTAPIVLQEFVNHGGVVFKVYVVGECVVCVTRKSLPDVSSKEVGKLDAVSSFSGTQGDDDDSGEGNVEMPCLEFVMHVAGGLREAMGLRLFNFDLIRDSNDKNRFLVIDINYLPAYAKMPNYEPFLTKFFLDIVHKQSVNDNEVVFC